MITNKRLCKGTLTTSSATLYTTPASTTTVIKAITICNKTASTIKVTIAVAGIEILYQHAIEANDTIVIPFIDQIIETTETITGYSDTASAANYYLSGKEIT